MSDRVIVKNKLSGIEVTINEVIQIDNFRGKWIFHTHVGKQDFDESLFEIVSIDKNFYKQGLQEINE